MSTYLYAAAFLIGVVLAYFALKQFLQTRKIVAQGVHTEAKVIDFATYHDTESEIFKPVFEYIDLSGTTKQFESKVGHAKPPMKIGDLMPIIYHQDSNEVKMASYWGLYRWTVLLLVFASPFLIIGGGYLLYTVG